METEEKVEEETTGGKLKSRKFWIAIITGAYFALMAIREQGINNTTGTIVCAALACIVTVGYIIVEGAVDSDRVLEDDDTEVEG